MSEEPHSDADEQPVGTSWGTRIALVAAAATLIAAIGGLYYNARSTRLATEQADQARQAQASERFSRSVDELGSPSVTVRTGAVYAFAGLMRDDELDDDAAIVDILNSFVRLRAQHASPLGRTPAPTPSDISAALLVLGGHHQINLARVDLSGDDLTGADLSHANLDGADLGGADLTSAALDGAGLIGARLDGTRLNGAYLNGAQLNDASLVGARLADAHLRNASLTGAHLTGADLTGADLYGADLTETRLAGANLERADLTNATLTGAELIRVQNIIDATFKHAFCGYPATAACVAVTRRP